MLSNKNILVKSFLVITLILFAFGAGFYMGREEAKIVPIEGVFNFEKGMPTNVDFSLFWTTWNILQEKYVNRDSMDVQKMVFGAISGMVKAIGDPYTVFMPPEETKIFKEDVSGEFQGVGMEIGVRDGEITVISPIEGTPAFLAGLKAGDIILQINGTSTKDMIIEEAVKLIRGPKGTEVILTVFRKGWTETKEFKINRDIIKVPTIKWELMENDEIAYVKIYHFSENADSEFTTVANKILNTPAKKLIIDLRGNPGGYLEVAQDIAGWFLRKEEIVTIEDFGPGLEKKEYKSAGNERFLNYPVIILINEGSASASEILAGALRDNKGTLLIGKDSFGKGSVQILEDLKNGSTLKISVAKWLTPEGYSISEKGLEPDIKVDLTEEDITDNKDPQLDKAIEKIKELR
ncbi:MAG: S41 family peptidase [Candidatus Parcubacteria bacterium]|nr:S41 family peptidase [Candidatus Parcubacteria bacterium]